MASAAEADTLLEALLQSWGGISEVWVPFVTSQRAFFFFTEWCVLQHTFCKAEEQKTKEKQNKEWTFPPLGGVPPTGW